MVSGKNQPTSKLTIELFETVLISILILGTSVFIFKDIYSAAVNTKYLFAGLTGSLLLITSCTVRLLKKEPRPIHPTLPDICLMFLILYLGVRVVLHPSPMVGLRDSFLWMLFPSISLLFPRILVKEAYIKTITAVVIAAASLVAAHGILQYFGYELIFLTWKGVPPHLKVMDTMGNPNFLAEYLLPVIPLAIAGVFLYASHKVMRRLLIAASIIIIYCFWLTGAYEVWIVLPICLLIIVFGAGLKSYYLWNKGKTALQPHWFRRLAVKTLSGLIVVIGLFYLSTLVPQWYYQKHQPANTFRIQNYADRFMVWEIGQGMIYEKPVWGWGAGGFRLFYLEKQAELLRNPDQQAFIPSANSTAGANANQAHNDYLQMTVDWGLAGIGLFLLWLVVFFREIWSYLRRQVDNELRIIVIGTGCGVIFILLDASVNFPLYQPAVALLFWCFCGMIQAITRLSKDKGDLSSKPLINDKLKYVYKGTALTVIILMIGSVFYLHHRLLGNIAMKSAVRMLAAKEYKTADVLFQKAIYYDSTIGEAYLRHAEYLTDSGAPRDAVDNAFLSFRYGTDNIERYQVLACACLKNGEPQRAIEILQTMNIIYPDYPESGLLRGDIYADYLNHPDLAIKEYKQYLTRHISDDEKMRIQLRIKELEMKTGKKNH